MSAIQESLKEMSVEELLALIAVATAEAKKKVKAPKGAKEAKGKGAKAPKKGSMEKGVLPPQLHESFAWVDYVLADAKANGWPAYAVKGKEEPEAASEERDGEHVFPNGKVFNRKNAMSLSKFYFSKKEGKGANEELYQQFAAQYVAPASPAPADVMDTDAEEKEASKAASAATHSVKPSASKEESKAEPKKEAKQPKAEPKKETPKKEAKEPKAKAEPKAAKAAPKADDEWLATCPKDDAFYPWEFKGVKYARNHKNHVYSLDEEENPDAWVGLFNGKKIDTSVDEPEDE